MSHFSVLVRINGDADEARLATILEQMLVPYKESGCGEDDPPELAQHLRFEDVEEENRKEYEEDTDTWIRLADGEFVPEFDKRFLKAGTRKPWEPAEYEYPADSVKIERPMREVYPTFDAYMKDYVGYSGRDEKTGRYGRWTNPNQKWDWWVVGGRFAGKLVPSYDARLDRRNWERCELCNGTGTRPKDQYVGEAVDGQCNGCTQYWTDPELKAAGLERGWKLSFSNAPFDGDVGRVNGLDFGWAERRQQEKIAEFLAEWDRWCAGEKFDIFDGPREQALRLGFIECKNEDELTGAEWKLVPWQRETTPGKKRYDVLKQIDRETFARDYGAAFYGFTSYAYLDSTGWHEPGEMGWWAMTDGTPDSEKAYAEEFVRWIQGGDRNDWLVVIDCHI